MKALEKVSQVDISQNVLKAYISLYHTIGRGEEWISSISPVMKEVAKLNLLDDIYYLLSLARPNHKITLSRARQFVLKNQVTPNNKDEQLLANICIIFDHINGSNPFFVSEAEIHDLARLLYKDVSAEPTTYKKATKEINYRESLDKICLKYKEILKSEKSEKLMLNILLYLDIIALSPFTCDSSIVALLVLYILSLSSDVDSLKYSSFFKAVYENKDLLNDLLTKALYLYDEDMCDPNKLIVYYLDIFTSSYDKIKSLYRDNLIDKDVYKTNSIENVISKLENVFSKEDIKRAFPNVSDSTINRTLQRLSKDGKIISYGTGRGAKWVKIEKEN